MAGKAHSMTVAVLLKVMRAWEIMSRVGPLHLTWIAPRRASRTMTTHFLAASVVSAVANEVMHTIMLSPAAVLLSPASPGLRGNHRCSASAASMAVAVSR